jgi:hypothetical protein
MPPGETCLVRRVEPRIPEPLLEEDHLRRDTEGSNFSVAIASSISVLSSPARHVISHPLSRPTPVSLHASPDSPQLYPMQPRLSPQPRGRLRWPPPLRLLQALRRRVGADPGLITDAGAGGEERHLGSRQSWDPTQSAPRGNDFVHSLKTRRDFRKATTLEEDATAP